MKKILFFMLLIHYSQIISMQAPQVKADVVLKSVINNTGALVKVTISGASLQDPSVNIMNVQEFKPGTTTWDKELRSKRIAYPHRIRLLGEKYKDWGYSPSGSTQVIDLVIEKEGSPKVVPSQAVSEHKASVHTIGPKAGENRPTQYATIVIKKIKNQSPEEVLVEADGQFYEIQPGKEHKINLEATKGKAIIFHTSTPKGDRSTTYVPSGKSENIDVMVDIDGTIQVQEAHEVAAKKVKFDDIVVVRPIPKIGKKPGTK